MTEQEWINEFWHHAHAAGDEDRLRLVSLIQRGYAHRERSPELALATYEEGRQLARRLHEPWWDLYYQAWTLSQFVHNSRDFRRARDVAVAAVLEVRKPAYEGCPVRVRLYQDFLAVHFCIDPHGYGDRIEEGFREIEERL